MNDFKTLSDDHRQYPGAAIDPTTGKFRVDQLPMDLASWEGSVLPALQSAIASSSAAAALARHDEQAGAQPAMAWQTGHGGLSGGTTVLTRYAVTWASTRQSSITPDAVRVSMSCATAAMPGTVILAMIPYLLGSRSSTAPCSSGQVAAWPPIQLETKSPPCATFSKAKDLLEARLRQWAWRERLATKHEITRAIEPSDPCAPPAGFVFLRTEAGIAIYREGGPEFRMPHGLRSCTYWNARTNAQQIERYPATANDAPGRWDGCEAARDWAAWALGEA